MAAKISIRMSYS